MDTIDPQIKNLVSAIGQAETGPSSPQAYNATGASGEFGRYQFMPDSYKQWAPEFGVDPNDKSVAAQNKVAYNKIKQWKDQGLNPAQIASKWNSGDGNAYKTQTPGVNSFGVAYDTPAYTQKVSSYYKQLSGNTSTPTSQDQTNQQSLQTPEPSIGSKVLGASGGPFEGLTGVFGLNPLLKGLGQTMANASGSTDAVLSANDQTRQIQQSLIQKIQDDKQQGKDTSNLESALSSIKEYGSNGEVSDLGTQGITNKQVIGSSLSAAASFIPGASAGTSLLTKVLAGAATGYAFDVGNKIQNDQEGGAESNTPQAKDFEPGIATVVGATLPFAGYLLGSLAKKVVGFTAGTGEQVIQNAIDNPDAVGDAVAKYAKNPEAKQELVDTATDAVQNFVKQKGQEFGNAIDNLATGEGVNISKQPALDALTDSMKNFGIDESNGELDFTNSQLSKEAESTLKQVFNKVTNWTDETPQGLDSLRQYLKGEMGNYKVQGSSKVDAILNSSMKALRTHLSEQLPGYSNILQNFSEKSQTTTELLKELGLGGSAKPSTKLSNIMRIFKKDPSVLDNLYKVMGNKEADSFLNEVSGAILSDWLPAGKVGPAMRTAGEVGLGIGAHALGLGGAPAIASVGAGLAASSPRVVGAAARVAGSRIGQTAGTILERGVTSGSSKLNP